MLDGFEFQKQDGSFYTYKNPDSITAIIDISHETILAFKRDEEANIDRPAAICLDTSADLMDDAEERFRSHDSTSLDDVEGLEMRTYHAIKRAGYNDLKQFVGVSRSHVMNIKNLGVRSFQNLEEVMKKYNIVLEEGNSDPIFVYQK